MNADTLLMMAIVFFAAFVQGVTGFGFVVVCVPLLSLLIGVKFAIPVIALCGMILAGYLFFTLMKRFEIREIVYLLLGGIPAIPIGALFLRHANEQIIKHILAAVIFLFCLLSMSKDIQIGRLDRRWGIVFGMFSGFFGGAFNANAPVAILYGYIQHWEKEKFKAVLSGYLFIMITLVVLSHIVTGLTDQKILVAFAKLLPILFIGVYMGHRLYGYIPAEIFKKIILVFLMVISATLVLT